MKNLHRNYFSILLILAVLVFALWQVSFFACTMKWDMMDYYFPTRYFISECFRNHTLPFWCPYMYFGYPIYADPQAGVWYPVNSIVAALAGYNIYTLQLEYIFHIAVAAFGMYKLLRTLKIPVKPATVSAIIYPLSGFFVSHASHPTLITSMAWMPFVFHYFISGLIDKNVTAFLKTALALALCLTGGYVVFFVLACYGMFFVFVYYNLTNWKQKGYFIRSTCLSLLAGAVFLLLCSGYLFSLLQALSYLKRADGLSLDVINVNSLSPKSLISFLLPFATLDKTVAFDTDVTMRNIYSGLLFAPLVLLGVFFGNKRRNIILLLVGLFCLSAAMGKFLPIREWLYYTVPFMKLFRHASIFRAFTLFPLLLIAADGLYVLFERNSVQIRRLLAGALIIEVSVIISLFSVSLQHENLSVAFQSFFTVNHISDFISSGNIYRDIVIQSIEQLLLLTCLLPLIFFVKGKNLAAIVSIFWITDMVMATQMNIHGTVVSDISASAFHNGFRKLPKGFPNPSLAIPAEAYNLYCDSFLAPAVYNGNLIRKEPCSDGFNPFYLKQVAKFSDSPLASFTMKHPVVFISSQIKPMAGLENDKQEHRLNNNSLYANVDSTLGKERVLNSSISLQRFSPDSVIIETSVDSSAYLTLLQAYFQGWKALVDSGETEIVITNYAFISIAIPAGKHQVSFVFKPTIVYVLWYIYILSYVMLIAYICFLAWRKEN